jgi:phage shock protein PspC (stress-responsive transcriptional regulator)
MKRDKMDSILFGVCSGLAKSLGIDVVAIRFIFLLLSIMGFGLPIIVYFILAIITPVE